MMENTQSLSGFRGVVWTADLVLVKGFIDLAYLDQKKIMLLDQDCAAFRLLIRANEAAYIQQLIQLFDTHEAEDKLLLLRLLECMHYNPMRELASKGRFALLKLLLDKLASCLDASLPDKMGEAWFSMLRSAVRLKKKNILVYLLGFNATGAGFEACLTNILYPFVVKQLQFLDEPAQESAWLFSDDTPLGRVFYDLVFRQFLRAGHMVLLGDTRILVEPRALNAVILSLLNKPCFAAMFDNLDTLKQQVNDEKYDEVLAVLPEPQVEEAIFSDDALQLASEGASTLTRPSSFNFEGNAVELTALSVFRPEQPENAISKSHVNHEEHVAGV